ncbi:MAG: DEAD/DEAH box helicase [Thermoleophilia bacterium]|nr:DEAD/DEAH box helicase [Thermoleophilia bacterium]
MTGTTKTGEAARFAAGDVVALRADAKRVGPIVAIRETEGGSRYSVFFAAGDVREYDGDQLVLSSEPTTAGLEHALAQARWLAPAEFRALLTAKRLARPENDSLYSLTAARINFIPFQFKPLIRILNSDQHRLFIADEVGVGKTIEAGLILKELDSRTPLENVLIVCPKALTQKWRAEMRRFDEEFEILTSETLKYCLQETHNDGVWPARYRRAIVHLELLRNEQYLHGKDVKRGGRRHGLFTLEPPPAFSMLILDEAHHVRNTETSSYELLQFLSEHSDAAVFLSATPVHTGAHNLFALLQLLREDRFLDKATFDQIVEPNRHLVDAVGFIRSKQPNNWQELAGGALATAAATWWGQNVLGGDPRFTAWRDRLVAGGELSLNPPFSR